MRRRRENKFMAIAKILEDRVKRGDYAFRKLPGECELAEETGVSRMTARKALKHLIDQGIFARRPHGRLEVNVGSKRKDKVYQIAFLMPPVVSEDVQVWQWAAEKAATMADGILRPVVYTDWNDVMIPDVLRGFDGIFLMQTGINVPEEIIRGFKNSPNPVVSLDLDLSEWDIPSIWLFPPGCLSPMLNHLKELGHNRIACLNTCKMNLVFEQRIRDWQEWKDENDLEGDLLDFPADDTTIDYGAIQSEKIISGLLQTEALKATAIVCTNVWTALGAMRAIKSRGLEVGRDISVCAVNDEMLAPWLEPTLTSLRMADPESLLERCVRWMISGGKDWKGGKLLTPEKVPLFIGKSTGRSPQ